MDPDDFSGRVVYDRCKVGMSLFMACFINPDSFEVFILRFRIFLLSFLDTGNNGSDSSPVDSHLLTDELFRLMNSEVGHLLLELFCEPGTMQGPGNIFGYDTVLRTVYPVNIADQDDFLRSHIKCAPLPLLGF